MWSLLLKNMTGFSLPFMTIPDEDFHIFLIKILYVLLHLFLGSLYLLPLKMA